MSDRNDDIKVYQDKKAKAEDYKSSAYTLLLIGVLGIVVFILMEAGVLPFQIAGSMGFKDGMAKAGAVLLEPIMKVEVITPDDYFGDIMGNVTARRGTIISTDDRAGAKVVDAEVPLSEMFGYATDLRSRTQGRGQFTMQFDHYSEVPKSVAEKVIGERAKK